MVAISLYRGNLHRVPKVPRRWPMPTRIIPLTRFKSLLDRRTKALSRLRSSTAPATSNPNSTPSQPKLEAENVPTTSITNPLEEDQPEGDEGGTSKAGVSTEVKDQRQLSGGDCSAKPNHVPNLVPEEDDTKQKQQLPMVADVDNGDGKLELQKPDDTPNSNAETTGKADVLNDKEKRKKEVEEKLQVLNAKKHSLVQLLKQISNAEEELKRRNSMHGMAVRPSLPLQVDALNDSGSMTRHATPRMGSEANLGGDMEGGEAEDVSNHNIQSRHIHQMSNTSPSSESPLRRPPYIQHNVGSHPSRSSLGNVGSPSRFAPPGHQGHPANLPTVSVSGTSYIASSPSPAASGGTSTFRDGRHPSPWN